MIVRALRRLVAAAAGVAVAAAVAAGALAWRLSRGPIPLDWLRPRLEAAFAGGREVTVGAAMLAWEDGHPEIRVHALRVGGPDDAAAITIPAAAVRLSVPALLHGRIAVSAIEIFGLHLRLVREPGQGVAGDAALARLGAALREGPLATLDALRLRDATLDLADPARRARWTAAVVEAAATRTPAGIEVSGRLRLGPALGAARVAVAGAWREREGTTATAQPPGLVLEAIVHGLRPALLDPALAAVGLPLDGDVRATFDHTLRARRLEARLRGGPGTLAWGADVLRVQQAKLRADVDLDDGDAAIRGARVLLPGGVEATGRGRIATRGGARTIDAWVALPAVPLDALRAHWPARLAPDARRWVLDHVDAGTARDAVLRVHAPPGAPASVEAALRFADVAVRPAPGLPAVAGASGRLRVEDGALRIEVGTARSAGLDVRRGEVRLSPPPERLALHVEFAGPLAAALALLHRQQPALAPDLGVPPSDVAGRVQATLDAAFPLARPPRTAADAGLRLAATLDGVAVPHLVRGADLAGGRATLTVAGGAVALRGDARLAGAPFTGELTQNPGDPASRRAVLSGRLDRPQRAALGLDPGAWLGGPVGAAVRVAGTRAEVKLDLDEATVSLPGLAKPAGSRGHASADLGLRGGGVPDVLAFEVAFPDAVVRGSARRRRDGGGWDALQAALLPAAGGQPLATLSVAPGADPRPFALRAPDVRALLRRAGTDAVRGGPLSLEGTVSLDEPGVPFDGDLDVRDVTVRDLPLLARVVALSSLDGVARTLRGRGIAYRRVSARLAQRWPVLRVQDAATAGGEPGLALDGSLDLATGALDLRGTLVPSYYGLNRAADRLPLVGGLVGQVTGGAITVVDFTARGRVGDPQVSVSPLSAVAPGRLRDLVRLFSR